MNLNQSMHNNAQGRVTGTLAQNLRILVVEDNGLALALTLMQLEKLGHRVEGAADGLEALEVMQQQEFDVIFMDLNMPRLDGLEATRLIRQQRPAGRGPYIIALTANSRSSYQAQCLEVGMDDFLAKPATRQEMALALHRAATGRPQRD